MNHRKVGRSATLLLAALTILAGLALPNGVGVPSAVGIGDAAPGASGQDPWAVWSVKEYDPIHIKPFSRELFNRHVAPISNEWFGWDAYVANLDPAAELSHEIMRFPSMNLEAIVPNRIDAGPADRAHTRRLARGLVVDHLKRGEGVLFDMMSSGNVHAVEFDWLHVQHVLPMPAMMLPIVGALFTETDNGEVLLAYIYAYDQPQFIARKMFLSGMAGAPLIPQTTWTVPIVSGKKNARFFGAGNAIFGDIAAGKEIGFFDDATESSVAGSLMYGESLTLETVPEIDGQALQMAASDIAVAPVMISAAEARDLAQQNGIYEAGDLTLDTPPVDGTIVFAEGNLTVHGWGWQSTASFFANGEIRFEGGDLFLRAAVKDTVAVSYTARIVVKADRCEFRGMLASPASRVKVTSSESTFIGPLTARTVRIDGQNNVFTDGTGASEEVPPAPFAGGEEIEDIFEDFAEDMLDAEEDGLLGAMTDALSDFFEAINDVLEDAAEAEAEAEAAAGSLLGSGGGKKKRKK